MTRKIPNLNKSICFPLLGTGGKSPELYIEKIEHLERVLEKKFIELLARIDIEARVKTDPYSLPYKEEILVTLNGESYMNGPYESKRVYRKIVKELLEKNVEKLRFYFWINVVTDIPEGINPAQALLHSFGRIEYRFRYFPA